jgi:hypothetical protein
VGNKVKIFNIFASNSINVPSYQNIYIASSVLDNVVPWGQYDPNYIIFRNVEIFKIKIKNFQNFFFPGGKESSK